MNRRTFICTVAGGFVGAARDVSSQHRGSVPLVGVLYTAAPSVTFNELVPALRELGYTNGTNIALEPRSSSGQPESLPSLATDIVRLNVAAFVAVGPAAVKAAVAATRSIP